jgi:serine/threonine protein kinase
MLETRSDLPLCLAHTSQVFRKADPNAIDLISKLLEYTPTQRLSAIDAMVHPFFDELRDPTTRLPDSRHPNGPARDMPEIYNFTLHGKCSCLVDTNISDNVTRTLDCPSPQPAARSATYPRNTGLSWPRFRIAELQAIDEGSNACAPGLRPCALTRITKPLPKWRSLLALPLMSSMLSAR